MPLIIPANSLTGGYEVDNSLRFNDGSSDYLNRTPASSGNRKTWTWSSWVKKSTIGSGYQFLFSCTDASISTGSIGTNYNGDNTIYFRDDLISLNLTPNAVHRDLSAWYHIVVALDTTQATASNRAKMWINGEQVTSFSTATYPSQNADGTINLVSGSYVHRIGTYAGSTNFFDGYLAEACFIDGQALDPTSFGEFDADTGIWKPIDVSGLTFGTNGFYLDFENSGSLGADVSGNGNNFTVNNLTSIDQTTDTPTNNFATLNPLSQGVTTTNRAYSNGNLSVTYNNGDDSSLTTMGVSTGKWYAEFKVTAQPTTATVGVGNEQSTFVVDPGNCNLGASTGAYGYFSTGQKRINGGGLTSYGSSYTTNDIIGIALNLDIGAIWFSKNGTWQASATITEIQNGTTTNACATGLSGTFFLGTSNSASGTTGVAFDNNFGNPPFTIASGNSDANGYGNFEYAVPSGYYALCTANLAEFG